MDNLHPALIPDQGIPGQSIPDLNAEDLMADLTASVALIQHQTERLAQLERALDQTLLQVEEARSQLVRQEWIEHQLAATEEFANVQQQAIHHLKGRLDEDDTLTEPVVVPPVATPSERLEVRYVQAQQQIQALSQKLREESIQPPDMEIVDEDELEEAWWQSQLLSLETEISKHFQTQAFLQQACAELEQERDHNQVRILELEHQTHEMQEQILRDRKSVV